MKKWGYFFLAAVWMSVFFTGSGWAKTETVTIALGSEPATLDPQIREDGGERAVNDNIYDTVLTINLVASWLRLISDPQEREKQFARHMAKGMRKKMQAEIEKERQPEAS
ncbi:MAG: hypothetical protein RQ739_07160 [Desulfotignum sp.]|nr:hypothetical protein [Desulfotignum sp.]